MQKVIVKTEDTQSAELKMFHIHLFAAIQNAYMDKHDLSKATGISLNYISDLLEGRREASVMDKINIAKAVGIPYDFLAIP